MKEIIFTADDFGVVDSIDEGIKDAIRCGLVKSVSVFANYPGSVQKAKDLLNEFPDVELGIHLTISSGKPLMGADKVTSLCNTPEGFFTNFKDLSDNIDLQELKSELEAQINIFITNDVPVYHLSNHHNLLTLLPRYYGVYLDLARKYNLMVRSPKMLPRLRQNTFIQYMRLMLFENVPWIKSKMIDVFGKFIEVYFKNNAQGVKTTDYVDSAHYGPIPGSKIATAKELESKRKKKYKKLCRRLWFLKWSCSHTAEFILHLHKNELKSHEEYKKEIPPDYPGIDYTYFDSRVLELLSIKSLTLTKLQSYNILPGSWKGL